MKNRKLKDITNIARMKPPQDLEKFKKKAVKLPKLSLKQLRKISAGRRNKDVNFKLNLRRKFIEKAKSFVGVPYARKHRKRDDPYYYSPIFLDCCGLVRKVVLDLESDFGFRLANGNQNYQMDQCPIKLTLKEMQPGDLIFYSATYFDSNKKVQKHNLTHVEIFLGGETGTMSIGSRKRKGVVSIFDDFRFVSLGYTNIVHHFRSLDTWLEGCLRTHCDLCQFKREKLSIQQRTEEIQQNVLPKFKYLIEKTGKAQYIQDIFKDMSFAQQVTDSDENDINLY